MQIGCGVHIGGVESIPHAVRGTLALLSTSGRSSTNAVAAERADAGSFAASVSSRNTSSGDSPVSLVV